MSSSVEGTEHMSDGYCMARLCNVGHRMVWVEGQLLTDISSEIRFTGADGR